MHDDPIAPGEVWLVGAGPGDPGLLTRKAEQLLKAATIVFHDALVGSGVMALVPAEVRRVYVGKRSGRHSRHQDVIGDMLLRAARSGERVVRLKGGDPAIFGRADEELRLLRQNGVSVHICPGVTAASAAAAGAGISLTLRGVVRKVVFVTGMLRADDGGALDYRELADPEAMLAVYMGKAAAPRIARDLVAGGLPRDTPVLLIENASLPDERILSTRLDLLSIAAAAFDGEGPMTLLVGAAARLPAGHPARVDASCWAG